MPKAIPLALNTSVGGTYDQTRTTLLGNASQKTLTALQGGKTVVGTPLNSIADVITDAGVTPNQLCVTANGRAFAFVAIAAGLGTIVHYEFNFSTGLWTYVGKLAYTMPNSPATTHTLRSVRVIGDSTTTGWQILVNTVGTVTANGGLFMLGHGTSKIAKTDFVPVGFATLPVATAANQKAVYFLQETGGTNLLTASQYMDHDFDFSGTNVYVGNNLVATHQIYKFDLSLTITTVAAGGITSDLFVFKTGTLPGITGTLLLLNNATICQPDATSGVPVANQGVLNLHLPASAGFNIGKLSDLSSGVTSWPSLAFCNASDVANTNTAVTPLTAHFSQTLQRCIAQFTAGKWFVKQFVNNQYESVFGNSNTTQFRTGSPYQDFVEWGGVSITSTFEKNGWLFMVHATAGQITLSAYDLRSDWHYDYSAIISKVIDIPNCSYLGLSILAPVRSFTKHWYRTSGFGSATGGWVAGPSDRDYSPISAAGVTQIQFKFQPRNERDGSTVPIQIIESHFMVQPLSEISDNWVGSRDNTTDSTQSPARSAFRLIKAYSTSVPTLYFRAYDDSGVLVASANTSANPTLFEYTTNNGSSWNSLGTIPNTINTTEVRYNWATPPGVRVTVSLRES